jgi:hypothetical protein
MQEPEHTKGFVIIHPEWGVFIGNCLGFAFWSRLDPVDQPAAVAFPTEAEAAEHARFLREGATAFGFVELPVTQDPNGELYASREACGAAGLPVWGIHSDNAQTRH